MRLRLFLLVCLSLLAGVAQAAPVATLNANYRPLHFGDYIYDTTPKQTGGGGNLVIGSAGLNTDWGTATSLTRIMEGEPWSPLKVALTIRDLPNKWSYRIGKPSGSAYESMRIGGGSASYDGVNGVWLQDYKTNALSGAWEQILQRPTGNAAFDTDLFQLGGSCQFTGNQFSGAFGLYWRDLPLTIQWFDDKGTPQGSQTLNVRYSVRIGPGLPQLALESTGTDMHFGTLISSSLAGSVELNQDDTRKASGGVSLFAGGDQPHAGAFRLRNTTPTRTYGGLSLTLPFTATLYQVDGSGNPVANAATMTVRNFGTTLTIGKETKTVVSGSPGIFKTVPGTDPVDFRIGAQLDVAANQPGGKYSGTYTLTVVNY